MDHAEVINNVNRVNFQIKQLIESFCAQLGTLTTENDSIVRDSVNIEQIRQVLNELALIDADLIFDREIIREFLEGQRNDKK
jgi:hypothetical protein